MVREDIDALSKGLSNLIRHVNNMTRVYRLPTVVALNLFPTDTESEIALVVAECEKLGVRCIRSSVWADGGRGGSELAREVIQLCDQPADVQFAYGDEETIEAKITHVVQRVYGGTGVDISPVAQRRIANIEALGFGHLPVCIAKTQYSFSDDPLLLGSPDNFVLHVKDVKVNAGAGFIVVYTEDVLTMPGLPKNLLLRESISTIGAVFLDYFR